MDILNASLSMVAQVTWVFLKNALVKKAIMRMPIGLEFWAHLNATENRCMSQST